MYNRQNYSKQKKNTQKFDFKRPKLGFRISTIWQVVQSAAFQTSPGFLWPCVVLRKYVRHVGLGFQTASLGLGNFINSTYGQSLLGLR